MNYHDMFPMVGLGAGNERLDFRDDPDHPEFLSCASVICKLALLYCYSLDVSTTVPAASMMNLM